MKPKFLNFKFENINSLAIFEYNKTLKKLIFLLKGCFDYEIRDILLLPFLNEIKFKYRNYFIVPIPSFKDNDIERGFNHVKAIFEVLELPFIDCLKKTINVSQHNLNFYKRKEIEMIIVLKERPDLSNKKILLVDDIMTTGGTLKTCINLIKTLNPKKIEILVIAKRILTKEEIKKFNAH